MIATAILGANGRKCSLWWWWWWSCCAHIGFLRRFKDICGRWNQAPQMGESLEGVVEVEVPWLSSDWLAWWLHHVIGNCWQSNIGQTLVAKTTGLPSSIEVGGGNWPQIPILEWCSLACRANTLLNRRSEGLPRCPHLCSNLNWNNCCYCFLCILHKILNI